MVIKKKKVLSGIRPTGFLHLGNYFGAIKGMLSLQENPKYETFYMVADLHAVNTPYEPSGFQESVRNVILDYLAAGLDPKRSTIFIQSHVPEHVELSYLFSTVLTVARMLHLPTYKDKIREDPRNANMAMLYYPVLMAADILIYKADVVPVGDDQLPHLEVAREVARKMNKIYGTSFPEPSQFRTKGYLVPSLLGVGKMSKSVEGSYIALSDSYEVIREKIFKVPTDEGRGKKLPRKGGVHALLSLVELFEGVEKRRYYEKLYLSEGIAYQKLKERLSLAIYEEIKPIQKLREKLGKDPKFLDTVVRNGAKKARKIAQETLKEVKEKMGLSFAA